MNSEGCNSACCRGGVCSLSESYRSPRTRLAGQGVGSWSSGRQGPQPLAAEESRSEGWAAWPASPSTGRRVPCSSNGMPWWGVAWSPLPLGQPEFLKEVCPCRAALTIMPVSLPAAIVNPKQPKETPKSFSFDYSYWSHTSVSPGLGFRGGGSQLRPAHCVILCQSLDLSESVGRGTHPLPCRTDAGGVGLGGGRGEGPAFLTCLVRDRS